MSTASLSQMSCPIKKAYFFLCLAFGFLQYHLSVGATHCSPISYKISFLVPFLLTLLQPWNAGKSIRFPHW